MKRILTVIIIVALLVGIVPVCFADGEQQITLTITCDPMPELEGEGTIPSLLFTIKNESDADCTLNDVKLSGGYEDVELDIADSIFILARGTKEFELTEVPVRDDQLDRETTYTLTWQETEFVVSEETGDVTEVSHERQAQASILIPRFVVPELTVSAAAETAIVRYNDAFTVEYTVRNDTEFDVTGIRLYDPEQSMQPIEIPASDLSAGASFTVAVPYQMGTADMRFAPRVDYVSRRREMTSLALKTLTVESVVVDLSISTEARPVTPDGNTFAVTVKNNGNRPVSDVCVYDEINTPVDEPFTLAPDEYRTVLCTIKPATSTQRIRTVQFHATAVDCMDAPFQILDSATFTVVPYVAPDSVQLGLSVVLQSPYYDANGKLCASIQFNIRNSGDVMLYNAVLSELTLFGEVNSYPELRNGNTYYTQTYQLDGVKELRFRVDAVDPAGNTCRSETIRLDLSSLKELADRKNNPTYVQTTNPYLSDLDVKYTGILRIAGIVGLCIAAICTVICLALYIVERQIRAKLPAEFEEDMERTLRATKRRTEKQLFSDAPTEQFGYTAPIKLRNYGELTEEEAKERRALYERGMRETLRQEQQRVPRLRETAEEKPAPDRVESDGTHVFPVRRAVPEQPAQNDADATRVTEMRSYTRPVRTVKASPVPDVKPYVRPERTAAADPEPKETRQTEQQPDVKPYVRPVRTAAVPPAPEPKEHAKPAVGGPRRIEEKERPARRPVALQPVRRMNG